MAGRFTSVVGARGWEEFVTAVRRVIASAHTAAQRDDDGREMPMAVLVQPYLRARVGGVMFGADPVTGRTDRRVIAADAAGPQSVVSGMGGEARYLVSRHGRLAVGPPTLEQVVFMRRLTPGSVVSPSALLTSASRALDAPRRLWSRLHG